MNLRDFRISSLVAPADLRQQRCHGRVIEPGGTSMHFTDSLGNDLGGGLLMSNAHSSGANSLHVKVGIANAGKNKDASFRGSFEQLRNGRESALSAEIQVQKNNVRLLPGDNRKSFGGRSRLGNHFQIGMCFEEN